MLCLGIETSCDDTSLALVDEGRLVAQASSTQADLHALFGGVVPEIASREHLRLIGPLCDALLCKAGVRPDAIDVVAVARGPGLLGSLLVGGAFAKSFALGCGARFIGVNHLHAHMLAAGLERKIIFPALGLLVSGGHTHLYYIDSPHSFALLGRTLDDAAGEAFDKAGKMLGLPYPAGSHIDTLARNGVADKKLFPRPYLDNDNLDFSFSGLKTAMSQYLAGHEELRAEWDVQSGALHFANDAQRSTMEALCASYSMAIVDTLVAKTRRALDKAHDKPVKSLLLAGGVAANSSLRERMRTLADERRIAFTAPATNLCTDNGAMIAYLGWLLAADGFGHDLSMEAIPRGRAIPDDMHKLPAYA
ncbi:tRNA (adenosine(37)-N6)-threonylcarbamoyltransferase complex transferase subunit TsaD [Desulfovibrio sp. OttesenSCG-928-G15]|nr:tRNA (adenosine(37)-N6)-threonylcarbamoyltransferase complex transferase subunit TsaD [Desulfovibrio sp. OttesenSCG-928-G15]